MSTRCHGNVCLPPSPYKKTYESEKNHPQTPIHTHNNPNPSPIPRTFSSAHMSSLTQKIPLKRAQSSNSLGHNQTPEKRGAFEDIWTSIHKNTHPDSASASGPPPLVPPYVHPLLKKSASLLSQKSLELCTESLGSETGSETGSEIKCSVLPSSRKTIPVVPTLPATSLPFPPPLPSLANRPSGSNLHMRSHRQDGRLILQAVPVATVLRFHAHRHGGRLRLVFSGDAQDPDESDEEEVITEEEEFAIEMEPKLKTLIINKLSAWPRSLNTPMKLPASLPPVPAIIPATGVATILNACEYYWRREAVAVVKIKSPADGNGGEREVAVGEKAEFKGEEEYLVPFLRGCKEPTRRRRSLLFWDSDRYCIATS